MKKIIGNSLVINIKEFDKRSINDIIDDGHRFSLEYEEETGLDASLYNRIKVSEDQRNSK